MTPYQGGKLVVFQTYEIHRKIENLLQGLHLPSDVEVEGETPEQMLPKPEEITIDSLADICKRMESAIVDVTIDYEWYDEPPLSEEHKTTKETVTAKGRPRCQLQTARPFATKIRFVETTTLQDTNGNMWSKIEKSCYNGKTSKHLSTGGFPQPVSTATVVEGRRFVPYLSLSPLIFSIFTLGSDLTEVNYDMASSLDILISRNKERVHLYNRIEKINGFDTIRADLLHPTKQIYLRIYFSVEHGYTPVRFEYIRTGSEISSSVEVNSLQKVADGLWFPRSGVVNNHDKSRSEYKAIGNIVINQGLREEDFDIEFPTGTQVDDQVRGIKYIVTSKEVKNQNPTVEIEALGEEGEYLRVYEVNRSVSEFSGAEDFSTPEAAYAAINRVSASGEASGWVRVSVKRLAERFAEEKGRGKMEVEPEWAEVLLNAQIVEVRIWKGKYAMVLAELPQEYSSEKIREPIDLRSLEFEDGRWLNAGNVRAWTVEEGRAIFAEACEYHEGEAERESAREKRIEEVMKHPEEIVEAEVDSEQPRVVSVYPASGSEMALISELQVVFGEPMMAEGFEIVDALLEEKFKDLSKVSAIGAYAAYDANKYQFTIPLILPCNWNGSVKLSGFKSVKGVEAEPVVLHYSTVREKFSEDLLERFEKAQESEELQTLIEKVEEMRLNLKSLSETVKVVWDYGDIREKREEQMVFKMQGDKQFYVDMSRAFDMPWHIGSDGDKCWFYNEYKDEKKLVMTDFDQIDEKNIAICEPFGIGKYDIDEAIKRNNLEYIGTETLDGRKCHLVRAWSADVHIDRATCQVNTWWIDAETYMPVQLTTDSGRVIRSQRFIYEKINQPIDDSEFRPDFVTGIEPEEVEPLGDGYERRFVNAIDGSGTGRMSVRWGKRGSAGTSSSGLN